MICLKRPYHFKRFQDYLPQIFGLLLNTLSQVWVKIVKRKQEYFLLYPYYRQTFPRMLGENKLKEKKKYSQENFGQLLSGNFGKVHLKNFFFQYYWFP